MGSRFAKNCTYSMEKHELNWRFSQQLVVGVVVSDNRWVEQVKPSGCSGGDGYLVLLVEGPLFSCVCPICTQVTALLSSLALPFPKPFFPSSPSSQSPTESLSLLNSSLMGQSTGGEVPLVTLPPLMTKPGEQYLDLTLL